MNWQETTRDTNTTYVNTSENDIVMENILTKEKVFYKGIKKGKEESKKDFKKRFLKHIKKETK